LLEAHSSLKGYSIAGSRIPILITLRKTSDLKPHEEAVAADLKTLVEALRANPVLRHPIIADRRTGIVLDGTHRLAAIKQLRCNFIPSALVDYDDPQITIEKWFRQFSGSNVRNLEKKEVVETVKKGKLFPPKSTRHLVPSRPLGGGVPIDWLRGSDFSEAQSQYQEYIQSRKVKRLPEGSRIGSRRYLEEVFLFE